MSIIKPGSYTDDGVYVPRNPIVLAFSFEGVVNDGAPECGLTTFNAYRELDKGPYDAFGRTVEPPDFGSIRESEWMNAFLGMRPCVNRAWEYFVVVDVLRDHPKERKRIVEQPDDSDTFRFLIDEFRKKSNAIGEKEKKYLDDSFYIERSRMNSVPVGEKYPTDPKKYGEWAAIQGPYPQSVNELRRLKKTQAVEGYVEGKPVVNAGFILYFATSKDETSTNLLCRTYSTIGLLDPDDFNEGVSQCVIPSERIFGKEREVPDDVRDFLKDYYEEVRRETGKYPDSRDKVVQMVMIARDAGLPHDRVWRVNDRFDVMEHSYLWDWGGFKYQFLIPGYTFPFEFDDALKDGRLIVIDKMEGAGEFIGEKARQFGH